MAAATTALSEGSGCPIAPFYRGGFERRLAMSRQAVGPEIAAAAWADGWAMSQEQAVAAALARRGTTPGPPIDESQLT